MVGIRMVALSSVSRVPIGWPCVDLRVAFQTVGRGTLDTNLLSRGLVWGGHAPVG